MNELIRTRPHSPERVKFTLDDVLLMQAERLFGDVDVELIEGEVYAMPSEGRLHLNLKETLNRWLVLNLGEDYGLIPDGTLKLSETSAPSPDFWIYPKPGHAADQRGPDVLLAIEIAVSSKLHDLGLKARTYREHGVREYWVIDPEARVTHVHRLGGEWPAAPADSDVTLRPHLLPGLALELTGLPAGSEARG